MRTENRLQILLEISHVNGASGMKFINDSAKPSWRLLKRLAPTR